MDTKQLIEEVILDLGNNKSLADVTSKVQIIVRLLGDERFKSWFDCEFVKGYQDEALPAYRVTKAADIVATYFVPRGFGAMHISGQSLPVANLGSERYDQIMTIKFKDTVSAIVGFSEHPENIAMSLSPIERLWVQEVLGEAQIQSVHKVISPSAFQTILDNVRSRIIDMFIELNETVFKGSLDLKSNESRHIIHQLVTNNITAGIVQTGSGTIEVANSTIGANVSMLSDDTKSKLIELTDRIEQIAKDADEEFDEVAENIVSIREELAKQEPKLRFLRNTFKAIAWSASVAGRVTIEDLVHKALALIGLDSCDVNAR